MFGASNKPLNADHHDVYFKGMPLWKGRVSEMRILLHLHDSLVSRLLEAVEFSYAGITKAWGCVRAYI